MPHRPTAVFLAASFLLWTAACERRADGVPDRDTFVAVVTELRAAERQFRDSAAFDGRRNEILARAGVTDSMLYAFIRAHGADAGFMAAVWDTIDGRLNVVPDGPADTIVRSP